MNVIEAPTMGPKTAGIDSALLSIFSDIIKDTNCDTLKEIIKVSTDMINTLLNPIKKVPDNLDVLFKYIPDIVGAQPSLEISTYLARENSDLDTVLSDQQAFHESLMKEIKTLKLDTKYSDSGRVATQWLLDENLTPSPHHRDLRNPKCISDFPCISVLKNIINQHDECIGEMNSCIVNCYQPSSARFRPHSDDEPYIDSDASICTFSIGATREFGIYEKKHSEPKLLKTFVLEDSSVFIMQPGTQECTKHRVHPPVNRNVDAGTRYSISFRKILSESVTQNNAPSPPLEKPTTLILGSSISKYLNSKKLVGKRNCNVINLSKSGSKIGDINIAIDNFYKCENMQSQDERVVDPNNVNKIIINIGTNDILNSPSASTRQYTPLQKLVTKLKLYYPCAKVYLTSVIPIPSYNAKIPQSVLSFNRMLIRLCKAMHCFYIDVFPDMLHQGIPGDRHINEDMYRWNYRKQCSDIHLSSRGLSVLARHYIKIIGDHFNPFLLG